MSAPTSYHSLEQAYNHHANNGIDAQKRWIWLVAKKHLGNKASTFSWEGVPQTPLQPTQASSCSNHGDRVLGLAPSKNASPSPTPESPVKRLQTSISVLSGWWPRHVADSWTIELISGFVSFAAITSIIGVLWGYDQKPMPRLSFGITLNAVISFLATISRTAIMLCVGTVLSQAKWLYFKKDRTLIDLQTLENASRGPLGSMIMLFKLRGSAVLYVAAFLTVATLSFDPFVQQLLTTETRVVSVAIVGNHINSMHWLNWTNSKDAVFSSGLGAQLTTAMLANVPVESTPNSLILPLLKRSADQERYDATTQPLISPLKPDCHSGNCIWKPYYTLDLCTQCRTTTTELTLREISPKSPDLQALIELALAVEPSVSGYESPPMANSTWEIVPKSGATGRINSILYAYPYDLDSNNRTTTVQVQNEVTHMVVWPLNFLAYSIPLEWYFANYTSGKSPFAGLDDSVVALGFAEVGLAENGLPFVIKSVECALTYCVQEYNRSVVQGNLVSNVLSTHYGTFGKPTTNQVIPDTPTRSWSAQVNGTTFKVDNNAFGAGPATLAAYLVGNSARSSIGDCPRSANWSCEFSMSDDGNYGISGALSNGAWQGINLTPDFATVLETANTMMGDILQQNGNFSVPGGNAVTKSFVVVRWAWITLPATIVILGLLVLFLTLWETMRLQAPIWKSSLLPLVYRYVDVDDSSTGGQHGRISPPSPSTGDGYFATSNLVSEFEIQAEATITRITKRTIYPPVWQLQSLEII